MNTVNWHSFFLPAVDNLVLLIAAALFIIAVFIIILLSLQRQYSAKSVDKLENLFLKIKEEIKYAVAPKFIEVSLGVNDLVDLAIEIWRIEQRIKKSAPDLSENQLKGLENSVQKLMRYIEKYDVKIVDYKNTKYNDGLNLDILSVEKDSSVTVSMIKETIEPTILLKGQVVRKAKVILLTNE